MGLLDSFIGGAAGVVQKQAHASIEDAMLQRREERLASRQEAAYSRGREDKLADIEAGNAREDAYRESQAAAQAARDKESARRWDIEQSKTKGEKWVSVDEPVMGADGNPAYDIDGKLQTRKVFVNHATGEKREIGDYTGKDTRELYELGASSGFTRAQIDNALKNGADPAAIRQRMMEGKVEKPTPKSEVKPTEEPATAEAEQAPVKDAAPMKEPARQQTAEELQAGINQSGIDEGMAEEDWALILSQGSIEEAESWLKKNGSKLGMIDHMMAKDHLKTRKLKESKGKPNPYK